MANNQELKHWRMGGNLTHCGVEVLPEGKDIPCIYIESIAFYESHKVAGRTVNNVWIATFAPNPYTELPMVLNSTNRKRLAKLAREDYLQKISNFPVRLTQEKTRDVQDGGETMGLRISKVPATIPPQPKKEVMTKEHPNFDKCVAHIKGGGTVDDLRVKYEISKDVELEIGKG